MTMFLFFWMVLYIPTRPRPTPPAATPEVVDNGMLDILCMGALIVLLVFSAYMWIKHRK